MTRRLVACCAIGIAALATTNCEAKETVYTAERPDTTQKNDFYASNREPLLPSPLIKLPIGSIKPRGWVRRQLELQADGFHGRLTEISSFLKKEKNAWLSPAGEGERGWEEVPYWLKGFGDTGYVLGDERIIKEARTWIEGAINSQQEDGWFGPDKGRKGSCALNVGRKDLWGNMVMLFALQSYYEYSSDPRVLKLMDKYFRWEMTVPENEFLPPYWQKQRAADNLFSVYWLYNRTGDKWLLKLAEKIHRKTANWTDDIANWHNVNFAQAFGGPTTYYMQSKNQKHLLAAERNFQKMKRMYGQVPGGMFCSDEVCRPGFIGPRQAVETCGMVEMMLSCETLLMITGDLKWADHCEDVTFNTFPASMTPDLKALRYLTAPNLVLSDAGNKSPGLRNEGPMLYMNPHGHRCCQHNCGHGWPYYAEHLWLATPDNGLAVVFYAASEVAAKVGEGTEVTIAENTNYPFDDKIEFVVKTPQEVSFPLYLRVPGWCKKPQVKINVTAENISVRPGSYIVIDRKWNDGDKVTLVLPMQITLKKWSANKDSISVNRGPLTYSLKIGEKYIRAGGTDRWPAWEIHPTTAWNYGLLLEGDDPTSEFQIVRKSWPDDNQPFEAEAAPIEIRVKAKKIPNWILDRLGLVGELPQSPVMTKLPVETVTLIPMGCARLRISAFPMVLPDDSRDE